MFTLERLLAASGGRVVRGSAEPGTPFVGGAFDSRIAEAGSLFLALRDRRDGHDFVGAALAHGARGALVERIPDGLADDALLVQVSDVRHALWKIAEAMRRDHPIPIVGITGNVGKTTTKQAAAATLGARLRVLAPAASYNNEIGVPLTLLRLEPTHEAAVLEFGFYVPGEIADLCRLVQPEVGIVTVVPDRPVHYARTPSIEAIARGKAELVESLPTDGFALLNADDARVRAMAGLTHARVVLYGESQDADLRASDVRELGLDGVEFRASFEGNSALVRLPMPGRHLVTAALAALGAAVVLDVPIDEAATALGALDPPAHRMSVRRTARWTVVDDSYNASPAAVLGALHVLRSVPGRKMAVLGDMLELGALAAEAHAEVGREAAGCADVVIGVGELARAIVTAARRSGASEVHAAEDAAEALVIVRRLLRDGDTVLVKGSRALELDRLVDALVPVETAV